MNCSHLLAGRGFPRRITVGLLQTLRTKLQKRQRIYQATRWTGTEGGWSKGIESTRIFASNNQRSELASHLKSGSNVWLDPGTNTLPVRSGISQPFQNDA